MKSTLAILRDVYDHSGYRIWVLLALLVVVGFSDGISMALLYPVLETLGMGTSLQAGQGMVGSTFNWLFAHADITQTLLNTSLVLITAVLVQGLLFTAQNWLLYDVQKKYVMAWQQQVFSDFLGAEWSYCVSQKPGEILNLGLTEAPRLGAALFAILQLIVTAVVLSVYVAVSLFFSWKLTLYLGVNGLVLFAVLLPIRNATRRYGAEYTTIVADLGSVLTEMISGAKFIKASASTAKAGIVVSEQLDRLRHNLTWSAFLPTTIRSGFEFVGVIIVLGALIYGLKVEHLGTAQLLVVIGLVARLVPRLMQLQLFHSSLLLSAPAYPLLIEVHAGFAAHRETRRSGAMTNVDALLPSDIVAQDIVVRHGEKVVLDHVNFVLPWGQIIGVVGPSGAGKSTAVDLIMGLIRPSGGRITVGGMGLSELELSAWRRKIGYVSQETFLFHDTIANNIRWSDPDASMEAVKAAAKAAGLEPVIAALPHGYDTIVGDRGAKLSGGQRQRISIARALVRRPAILLLDEATSALDSLSEQEVMKVVAALRGQMTIVIVAHRLSTLRAADVIYVLDGGSIVEHGSWTSLSNDRALFHRLMQAQSVPGYG